MCLQKAIGIDPKCCFLNDLGYLYNLRERYPEAIEQYEKAIWRDPTNNYAQLFRGLAQYRMNDLRKARISFEISKDIFDAKLKDLNQDLLMEKDGSRKKEITKEMNEIKLAKAAALSNIARIYIEEERYKELTKKGNPLDEASKIYSDLEGYIAELEKWGRRREIENITALKINYGILHIKRV